MKCQFFWSNFHTFFTRRVYSWATAPLDRMLKTAVSPPPAGVGVLDENAVWTGAARCLSSTTWTELPLRIPLGLAVWKASDVPAPADTHVLRTISLFVHVWTDAFDFDGNCLPRSRTEEWNCDWIFVFLWSGSCTKADHCSQSRRLSLGCIRLHFQVSTCLYWAVFAQICYFPIIYGSEGKSELFRVRRLWVYTDDTVVLSLPIADFTSLHLTPSVSYIDFICHFQFSVSFERKFLKRGGEELKNVFEYRHARI